MLFHLILNLNNFSFPFNESIANTILLDVSNIYLIKFEIPITLILFILSTNNSIKIKKGRKKSVNKSNSNLAHPTSKTGFASIRIQSTRHPFEKFESFFLRWSKPKGEEASNQVGDTFLKAV